MSRVARCQESHITRRTALSATYMASFILNLINGSLELAELFDNQVSLEGHLATASSKSDVRNGKILCPAFIRYGLSAVAIRLQYFARRYRNFQFAFCGISEDLIFRRCSPGDRFIL